MIWKFYSTKTKFKEREIRSFLPKITYNTSSLWIQKTGLIEEMNST